MFSKRLKELRIKYDLTQKELAEKLNMQNTAVSKYELNERKPDLDTLQVIADFFNTTTDYLLGRTDIKNPYEPETIAAHHGGEEFTEEELEDIEKFKEFVKMRREQKDKQETN